MKKDEVRAVATPYPKSVPSHLWLFRCFKPKMAFGLGRKFRTSCSPMKVKIRILSVENEAVTVTNAGLKTPQVIQQLSSILFPHTLYFWSQNAKPSTDETVPMKS